MSTDVMGVFGEVSKVVPLWCSCKHGPHGKTFEEVYKKPIGVVMEPEVDQGIRT
jgi:hypothetical protein